MKKPKARKLKEIIADKVQIISILFFVLSLFLLDVNANLIGAYGNQTLVNIINGIKVPATSMFWLGFIACLTFFFLIAIRSMYFHKTYPSKIDLIFGAMGTIGLMIILSGGLLVFWHNNALAIPFFSIQLTRISYYHTGIGLTLFSIFYFALTK